MKILGCSRALFTLLVLPASLYSFAQIPGEQGNTIAQDNLRRMAETGSAAARPSTCTMVQIDHWPIRLANNKLIIDGAINGQKVGIMIDTGAMRTMIFRPVALRLGLTLRRVSGVFVTGLGGSTDAEAADVNEIRIGKDTRKDWKMLVAGEHDPGDGVAVILGEDFFQNVDVEFDLAHNAIRLFQPVSCVGRSLAYWAPDGGHEVTIEAFSHDRPRILVPVRINGRPIVALLDSGAGVSVLSKTIAARLGVRTETAGVIPAGRLAGAGKDLPDVWIGPFESFEIGNERIRPTTIRFADLGNESNMLLGADFLTAHRLLVAHSQRKIYFTYVGGSVFQR